MKKIMSLADVRFDFQEPKVQIPDSIASQYNEAQIKEIRAACLADYAQGLVDFDEALGEVLSVDADVVAFSRKMATRMVQLIDAATEVAVKDKITTGVLQSLRKLGISDEEIAKRAPIEIQKQLELEKNAGLSKVIGQKAISGDHSKVAIDFGNVIDQGFSGMSPQSIRNVLKNGNLREAMYILFRPATYYYRDLLLNPHAENVAAINKILQAEHGWQIDIDLADEILKHCSTDVKKRYGVNAPGAYYNFGFEREERSKEEQERYLKENPAPQMGEVALSEREKFVHTGDITQRQENIDNQRLPWRSGTAEFKEPQNKKLPYAQAAEAMQQKFVASLSGTTDRILTISAMLGYGSYEELIQARKACLGWLVLGKNHTSDEVLVPSKSFHLPYTPGPKGYQDIDPGNDKLLKDIEKRLKKKSKVMPEFYLGEKNVEQVAQRLFKKSVDQKRKKVISETNFEPADLESKYAIPDVKRFHALDEQPDKKIELPEYQQRHIIGLNGVSQWSPSDTLHHKKYNRILQPEFTDIAPDRIIELAILAKEDWLTDWLCPKVLAAAKLNIAANLIVNYKVSSDDLDTQAQAILEAIQKRDPAFFDKIITDVDNLLAKEKDSIKKTAEQKFQQKYPTPAVTPEEDERRLAAFIQLETERKRMAVQNDMLATALERIAPEVEALFHLERKPLHAVGQNHDFAFLGAPGSGKSTLSNQYLDKKDKANYVSLATDDYRGISILENHEKISTDQVFIKTQDSAYYIKELVQKRLEKNANTRPDLILDCVSIEGWHKTLLLPSKQNLVSTIACLDDISLVPTRAYLRAIDEKSGPADKGRQVNTTSLFRSHQDSSTRLLSSLPPGVRNALYDTNVPYGAKPLSFATVDLTEGKRTIEVNNLAKLSNFVCKANVNVNAQIPEELYFTTENDTFIYRFDKHHQAEQVFNMIKSKPNPVNPAWSKPSYEMVLKDNNQDYARITENQYGLLIFNVIDPVIFQRKLKAHDNDARALTSLILQINCGSIDKVRTLIEDAGSEDQAIRIALESVAAKGIDHKLTTKDIPPFSLHTMVVDQAPTLNALNARFGGLDEHGKIKHITVIPLLIKDSDNHIWVYGRKADGKPNLQEVARPEIYENVNFPTTANEVAKLEPNQAYQAVYNNMSNHKYHYYNFQALRSEERTRRIQEAEKRSAEYMRQHKLIEAERPKSERPRPVIQGGVLAEPKKDVLKDVSTVKPPSVDKSSKAPPKSK